MADVLGHHGRLDVAASEDAACIVAVGLDVSEVALGSHISRACAGDTARTLVEAEGLAAVPNPEAVDVLQ